MRIGKLLSIVTLSLCGKQLVGLGLSAHYPDSHKVIIKTPQYAKEALAISEVN